MEGIFLSCSNDSSPGIRVDLLERFGVSSLVLISCFHRDSSVKSYRRVLPNWQDSSNGVFFDAV